MGLPLYGRVWQKQAIAKALKYPQTLELWKQFPNILQKMEDGTAYFSFQQTVDAVVYYESEESLLKKLLSYQAAGVETVALWRLSQEPASFWSHLALHKR